MADMSNITIDNDTLNFLFSKNDFGSRLLDQSMNYRNFDDLIAKSILNDVDQLLDNDDENDDSDFPPFNFYRLLLFHSY